MKKKKGDSEDDSNEQPKDVTNHREKERL